MCRRGGKPTKFRVILSSISMAGDAPTWRHGCQMTASARSRQLARLRSLQKMQRLHLLVAKQRQPTAAAFQSQASG
jgi:hypothetical protein